MVYTPPPPPPSPVVQAASSIASFAANIPIKAVNAAVENPAKFVKGLTSFAFGPGIFLVGMLLAAVAWTAAKGAAIADTKIFKSFLGTNVVQDAQWAAHLKSIEASTGAIFNFCFYSWITGAKLTSTSWADYSARTGYGNISEEAGYNEANANALKSQEEQLKAIQAHARAMDENFFSESFSSPAPAPSKPITGGIVAAYDRSRHEIT